MVEEKVFAPASGFVTLFSVAFHAVLWAGVLLLLMLVVPRFERTFADFDAELPAMTLLTVRASRMTVQFWYLAGLIFVVALASDAMCLVAMPNNLTRMIAGVVLALIPLLVGVAIFLTLWLPMQRVIQALQ